MVWIDFKLKFPRNFTLNTGPKWPAFNLKFPRNFNLNAQKQFIFVFVTNRCISKTKMDRKYGPNPMERVPGPEVGKKYAIFGRISLKIYVWGPFLRFWAHVPPFWAFPPGDSIELRFKCNGIGLGGSLYWKRGSTHRNITLKVGFTGIKNIEFGTFQSAIRDYGLIIVLQGAICTTMLFKSPVLIKTAFRLHFFWF